MHARRFWICSVVKQQLVYFVWFVDGFFADVLL